MKAIYNKKARKIAKKLTSKTPKVGKLYKKTLKKRKARY